MFAEQPGVILGARCEIASLDRHCVKLRGTQHRGCDQQVGNLARVPPFVVLRHHPLIHLEDLQVVPVDVQAAQIAEHPPHGAPAA